MDMDPVALILTALTAGAKDTASPPVRDAYAGLKAELATRLAGRDGEVLLSRYEADPRAGRSELATELAAAGAAGDDGLVRSAQALLSVADEPGWRAGKYTVQPR
jgi:hypothetical protein